MPRLLRSSLGYQSPRSSVALLGYSELLVAAVVVSDVFVVMAVGGVVSEVVAGFAELIAALFAAFLEVVVVVTKIGSVALDICK